VKRGIKLEKIGNEIATSQFYWLSQWQIKARDSSSANIARRTQNDSKRQG